MTGRGRLARALLRLAGALVPRWRRGEWRQEWDAEIAHREDELRRWGAAPERLEADLARRAAGAVPDALWLKAADLREGIGLDVKHACRRLRKEPAFVLFVVLIMAVGIGANTALVSLVRTVLLRPLPYPAAARLVRVWELPPDGHTDRDRPSPGNFQFWRDHLAEFDALAAWHESSLTLHADGLAETRASAQVSNDFFRALGVQPLLGRAFTDDEVDRALFSSANTPVGDDPVVILSHRTWQQRFGGDPGVIGSPVEIERRPWRIVGVMPPTFRFPSPDTDLWIPWSFARERPRDQYWVQVMGRLAPGVTREQARVALDGVSTEMARLFPETNRGRRATLVPLKDEMVQAARPALWSLLGAVGCVLLVVCLNVAGLQVVRGAAQRHENAVRVAIGASRARLLRQSLVESLLLAVAGGAVGVLVARWLLTAVQASGAAGLPRLAEVSLDGGTLAVSAGLTLATGVLFGLGPLAAGAGGRIRLALSETGASLAGSRRASRLRRGLVVAEVALAVVLVAGAGLLLRSFVELNRVDPGFDAEGVLVLPVLLDGVTYGGGGRSRAYYRELETRLANLPGVLAAGGATVLPTSDVGADFACEVWRPGRRPAAGEARKADIRMATPGYFDTLRIPVLEGRGFDAGDTPDSTPVVMVTRELARRHWGDDSPVGQTIEAKLGDRILVSEVVGVVGDIRVQGPRSPLRPGLYIPHAQRPYLAMNMAVRVAGSPEALLATVRDTVLALDDRQPAHSIVPLERLMAGTLDRDRLVMLVLTAFGVVALMLAAAGVYGLLSYQVARRQSEIAVRMALGARGVDVVAMVVRQGLALAAVGLAVGLLAALVLGRALTALLYGVRPTDPLTFVVVAALFVLVAGVASLVPARRAVRGSPALLLRRS